MSTYAKLIEGLEILGSYEREGLSSYNVTADEDKIWAGPMVDCFGYYTVDEDTARPMSEDDMVRLAQLGWCWDGDIQRYVAWL